MPLHDWTDERGWSGLHMGWQISLLDWVQERLPPDYRAFSAGVPALTIDTTPGRPDLSVREWNPPPSATRARAASATLEPDAEAVGSFQVDPLRAVHIDLHGQLVAAIELISPRNKDRPASRDWYTNRYTGYIQNGVHLMLIDVLPSPAGFSFADAVGRELGFPVPDTPVPFAMSYRVGEPVPEGTLFAFWRRPLTVGQPLPMLPLALNVHEQVLIDLEYTYTQAARRVYLT